MTSIASNYIVSNTSAGQLPHLAVATCINNTYFKPSAKPMHCLLVKRTACTAVGQSILAPSQAQSSDVLRPRCKLCNSCASGEYATASQSSLALLMGGSNDISPRMFHVVPRKQHLAWKEQRDRKEDGPHPLLHVRRKKHSLVEPSDVRDCGEIHCCTEVL